MDGCDGFEITEVAADNLYSAFLMELGQAKKRHPGASAAEHARIAYGRSFAQLHAEICADEDLDFRYARVPRAARAFIER